MKVITFASSKGGVGKTTLAYNCAIHLARSASVYIIDQDPTKALTRFFMKRSESAAVADSLLPDNPTLLDDVGSVSKAVAQLRETEWARDFLIIDTPNAFMAAIKDAIAPADVVVLPVEASPVDILVNEDVVRAASELGKTPCTLYVVNPVDNRSRIGEETAELLKPLSPNAVVKITGLTEYRRALISGQAAVETNKQAATEIGALCDAIVSIARKSDGHTKAHGRAHVVAR